MTNYLGHFTDKMYYQRVYPNASISFDDYINGTWSFSDKNEEDIFEDMSPDLQNIVYKSSNGIRVIRAILRIFYAMKLKARKSPHPKF